MPAAGMPAASMPGAGMPEESMPDTTTATVHLFGGDRCGFILTTLPIIAGPAAIIALGCAGRPSGNGFVTQHALPCAVFKGLLSVRQHSSSRRLKRWDSRHVHFSFTDWSS